MRVLEFRDWVEAILTAHGGVITDSTSYFSDGDTYGESVVTAPDGTRIKVTCTIMEE